MNNKTFSVGFARVDATPTQSVPLDGYGNPGMRMSNRILDGIFITSVALRDENGKTALFITADYSTMTVNFHDRLAEDIKDLGISADCIVISATHTHSGPSLGTVDACDYMPEYIELVHKKLEDAARASVADLKPAEIYSGTTYTKGMNFVRHYRLEDGTYAGDNFGHFERSPIADYATKADPAMHIVKFVRTGGKDVYVINWRAHAHKTGGQKKYDLSADFPLTMRNSIEEKTGALAAFFQGASGNINHQSRIPEDRNTTDYVLYGKQLAQYVIDAENNGMLKKRPTGDIKSTKTVYSAKTAIPTKEQLENAKIIRKLWVETNDRLLCVEKGEPLGIRSPYHANAILGKATLPPAIGLDLYGFSVGDVAFLSAPDELFDTYCKQVTDDSPFATTMIFCLANGYMGYIPSAFGYDYTCYESDCGRYVRGTGEAVAACFTEMLEKMKKE